MPVHRATVEKHGRFDQAYTGWTKPGEIVTNGPFALTDWLPGQEIIVQKNARYWDAANVRLSEHSFPSHREHRDTEERAFRSGQLHLTEYVPGTKLKTYHDNEPQLLKAAPFFMTLFLRLRHDAASLQRRARAPGLLARPRPRPAHRQRALPRPALPPPGYVPPGVDGYTYEGPDKLRFDPAEAQRLLAAAGYPDGQGFPAVDITFPTNGRHPADRRGAPADVAARTSASTSTS